jgi:hypothetical protein
MDSLGNLGGLHELYAAFHLAMAVDRDRDYPILDLEDFTQWWASLSPELRADYAADYKRGYENVVSDARREIKASLAARR